MPQRFTLRVIFAITSGSALLFGAFSALQAPVLFVLWFYGLLMFVAVAQSFLFRGIRPRASSIIAGTLYVVASCLIAIAVVIASNVPYRLSGMPCICAAVFFGPAAGYVAGLLVASLLAVVDIGERIVKRRRSPSDVDGNTD
ncbi:MAG: hypothetical protein R3E01_25795 [Pirellulaceae bacterium]|nr:hypothetical protein [Planctomycetales bacterium]